MTDTVPTRDDDLTLLHRAIEIGLVTQAQVDVAVHATERLPSTRIFDHLPLTPVQLRALDAPARVPPEVAEAMKDPSKRVGRYRLLDRLGNGAMGTVHLAWDADLGRRVALKFLKQIGDEKARAYFRREAQLAASLDHPNIAKIYEIGEQEDAPFIAMQLVDGETLWTAKKTMKAEEKLAAMKGVARALVYAHERRIIHRDLKPANVMIDRRGQVFVMDFGLAKETAVEGESLAGSNAIVGTPNYMAPEQAEGKADPQSDVYGMGAVLYELITGRPPFVGESMTSVLTQVVSTEPVWPSRLSPGVPEDVEAIILHALEKDRKRRYASAAEFLEDLEKYEQREPLRHARRPTLAYVLEKKIRKQPLLWATATALVLAVAGGAAFGLSQLVRAGRESRRAESEARRAQAEAEAGARAEREGRERTEAALRKSRIAEWNARLETSRGLYERSFRFSEEGRDQAAAASLLRAVELAPRGGRPEEYPVSWDNPGWAEDAWLRFRFLDRRSARLLHRLEGHGAVVTHVAVSPDGMRMLSGSRDGILRLWDLGGGTEIRRFEGHMQAVTCLAFSPDGTTAASGSSETSVRMWDLGTGKETGSLDGHVGGTIGIAFRTDGRQVVTASRDGRLKVWDREARRELGRVELEWQIEMMHEMKSVALSSDGKTIIGGCGEGTLFVWDARTGEKRLRLDGHRADVLGVSFHADGRSVLSASADRTARLWDVRTGKQVSIFEGHDAAVLAAIFTPDGNEAVTASADGTVRFWDLETGKCLRRIEGHEGGVNAIAATPDGRRFLTGCDDKAVRIWERTEDAKPKHVSWHVKALAVRPDGRGLAATWHPEPEREELRFFDVKTLEDIGVVRFRPPVNVVWAEIDPSGYRAVLRIGNGTAIVWDLSNARELARLGESAGGVFAPSFSSDGKRILAFGSDNTIAIWEAATGKELARWKGSDARIFCLTMLPGGKGAATAHDDGTVRIWDCIEGKELLRIEARNVLCLGASPDGSRVLSGSEDGTVRIWDAGTGAELRRLEGPSSYVRCVTCGRDGRTVLGGCGNGVVWVWDAATGVVLRRYEGHQGAVSHVALSPDGALALSGSEFMDVGLWTLFDPRTPADPPGVHPDDPDPYREFEPLYRSIGVRVVREGAERGRIVPAR